MSHCEDIQRLIEGTLDVEGLVAARSDVAQHVESCSACRSLLHELRSIETSLATLPLAPAPPSLIDAVMGELPDLASEAASRHAARTEAKRKLALHVAMVALAAIALVLVVAIQPTRAYLETILARALQNIELDAVFSVDMVWQLCLAGAIFAGVHLFSELLDWLATAHSRRKSA